MLLIYQTVNDGRTMARSECLGKYQGTREPEMPVTEELWPWYGLSKVMTWWCGTSITAIIDSTPATIILKYYWDAHALF